MKKLLCLFGMHQWEVWSRQLNKQSHPIIWVKFSKCHRCGKEKDK